MMAVTITKREIGMNKCIDRVLAKITAVVVNGVCLFTAATLLFCIGSVLRTVGL